MSDPVVVTLSVVAILVFLCLVTGWVTHYRASANAGLIRQSMHNQVVLAKMVSPQLSGSSSIGCNPFVSDCSSLNVGRSGTLHSSGAVPNINDRIMHGQTSGCYTDEIHGSEAACSLEDDCPSKHMHSVGSPVPLRQHTDNKSSEMV